MSEQIKELPLSIGEKVDELEKRLSKLELEQRHLLLFVQQMKLQISQLQNQVNWKI